MLDDATSRLTARFVRHDSTEENLRQLGCYVEQHGRPVSVYTDKASLFQMAPRAIHHRDAPIWVSCSSATRAFSGTGDVSA